MKTITFDETKWKLVPIEPTEEMIAAGNRSDVYGATLYSRLYKDMLAVSPTPPTKSEPSNDHIVNSEEKEMRDEK